MSFTAHTETYKGYKIEIKADDDPLNPYTDWDHFGTFYHWHRRGFAFGEDYSRNLAGIRDLYNETLAEGGVAVPVWLYEHSGQTIRAGTHNPFACPWDSGQVGFWIATKKEIEAEFGGDIGKAIEAIKGEVSTMDDYLTGNCWGYEITKGDDFIDSCWGFIGDDKYCLDEAKSVVDQEEKRSLPLLAYAGLIA